MENSFRIQLQARLDQIDAEIAHGKKVMGDHESSIEEITLRIQEIKALLEQLNADRAEHRHGYFELEKKERDLAFERESILQQLSESTMMEETINKVVELIGDTEGWQKARGYQREDIVAGVHAYMSSFDGFMNANDMGLGKTMESFMMLQVMIQLHQEKHGVYPRVLWLTKSSLLKTGGTQREANRWFPELTFVPVDGSKPKKQREFMFDMIKRLPEAAVITNYETCRTTDNLKEITWDFIVMDEVHKLKGGANQNGPTAIWTAVKEVCETARYILMLTGTPMVNRPAEMWAYLHIFDPERFQKLRDFETLFEIYDYKTGEYVVNADKLLNEALKGRMIRRAKTDPEVKLDLPEITPYEDRERLTLMEGDQLKAYEQMRDRFFVWLDEQSEDAPLTATAVIAQLTRLRQINIWPVIDYINPKDPSQSLKLDIRQSSKIDEAFDIIDDANDQVVVFCSFNEPLKEVARRAESMGMTAGLLTGENSANMSNLEYDFQQGKIKVLCINSAMGEGLNLQKNPEQWPGGSATVIFLDLWWNSARNDQCTDRCYRQGANEAVNVYHIKNEDSVDAFIDAIIEGKDVQIKGVTESKTLRPTEWKEAMKGLI